MAWGAVGKFIRGLFGIVPPAFSARPVTGSPAGRVAAPRAPGEPSRSSPRVPAKHVQSPTLTWLAPGQRLTAGGGTTDRALTYLWLGQVRSPQQAPFHEPSAISPLWPADVNGDCPPLPYWPSYAEMTPGQRATYLRWLTGGRKSLPPEAGYMFVFYYGLERRALVEGVDRRLVFDEVMRLRDLFAAAGETINGSFDRYSFSLLWFLAVRHPAKIGPDRIARLVEMAGACSRQLREEHLASLLSWYAQTNRPLAGDAARVVASALPASRRTVVHRRVPQEFRELFARRFVDRFGEGLMLIPSAMARSFSYQPASGALHPIAHTAPNPHGRLSQLKNLGRLWNDCTDELGKLSRLMAKAGVASGAGSGATLASSTGKLTLEAWDALPPELREAVDHPAASALTRLAEDREDEEGFSCAPVELVAEATGCGDRKLTAKTSARLAEIAEAIGFCLEPDPRLTGRPYRPGQNLAIFPNTFATRAEAGWYTPAATALRLSIHVARADGHVSDAERHVLERHLEDAFDLRDEETARLEMLGRLLSRHPPVINLTAKHFERTAPAQKRALADLAVLVAAADGHISGDEIKAVRGILRKIGFGADEIDALVAEHQAATRAATSTTGAAATGQVTDDPPVVVAVGAAKIRGEAIPPEPVVAESAPPRRQAGLRLDPKAIAFILRETQEVSGVLAEAMEGDEEEPQGPSATTAPAVEAHTDAPPRPPVAPLAPGAPPPLQVDDPITRPLRADLLFPALGPEVVQTGDFGLPARYAALYQRLIARSEWDAEAVQSLAREMGLMPSAAMEAINDWSMDQYGAPLLVEEGSQLFVQVELLN